MEYEPREFTTRHAQAAEHFRVGQSVSLFTIDEETEEESAPFDAIVRRILDREPPLIELVVEGVDRATIQGVAEILATCAMARQAFLHVIVQRRQGAFIRSASSGFILKLLAPHGPEHEFVPIETGSLDEARRMRPERFALHFTVELID